MEALELGAKFRGWSTVMGAIREAFSLNKKKTDEDHGDLSVPVELSLSLVPKDRSTSAEKLRITAEDIGVLADESQLVGPPIWSVLAASLSQFLEDGAIESYGLRTEEVFFDDQEGGYVRAHAFYLKDTQSWELYNIRAAHLLAVHAPGGVGGEVYGPMVVVSDGGDITSLVDSAMVSIDHEVGDANLFVRFIHAANQWVADTTPGRWMTRLIE